MRVLFLFLILFFISACQLGVEKKESISNDFHQIPLKYAQYFQLFENDESYQIKLLQEDRMTVITSLIFSKENNDEKRVAVFSSTAIGFLDKLNLIPAIDGVESINNVYNPDLNHRIELNQIKQYGNFSATNVENLYQDKINYVFYSLFTAELPKVGNKFEQLSIHAIPLLDWSENHPLGRTEWIKVFGVVLGCYEQSVQEFDQIEQSYLSIKKDLENQENSPKVMCGTMVEDVWYMPGGKSYMAQFILDAGGDYVYKEDHSTKSKALTFEQVYRSCKEVPIWINIDVPTRKQMMELYTGYKEFMAYQSGDTYSYTVDYLRYFEESTVKPEQVLKDLSIIFSKSDLTNLYFYRKVE